MNSEKLKSKVYISIDLETDGPSPLLNNLLSIGLYGLDKNLNCLFEYEANLEELSGHQQDENTMKFWLSTENNKAWNYLQSNKQNPIKVFEQIGLELKKISNEYNIVFVASPSCYDWMFFKSYYEYAKKHSENKDYFYDIGYRCECCSTLWRCYIRMEKLSNSQSKKLYEKLGEFDKNTEHFALYDAKTQGKLYVNLLGLFYNKLNINLY